MEIGRITTTLTAASAAEIAVGSPSARSPEQVAQERQMIQKVKALNSAELFGSNSELTFVFDRQTHRALARVVDRVTGEVVMQVPPEYLIRMAEAGK